jgi:hypothetical protein
VNIPNKLPEPPDLIDVVGAPGPELARYLIRKLSLAQSIAEQRRRPNSAQEAA